jgi:hypothetical protein
MYIYVYKYKQCTNQSQTLKALNILLTYLPQNEEVENYHPGQYKLSPNFSFGSSQSQSIHAPAKGNDIVH